jgi:hypothetical protein
VLEDFVVGNSRADHRAPSGVGERVGQEQRTGLRQRYARGGQESTGHNSLGKMKRVVLPVRSIVEMEVKS